MQKSWRYTSVSITLVVLIVLVGIALLMHRYNLPDINQAKNIENIVPVLIIGSGPAGLSAALYTARTHLNTLVLAGHQRGGQLADVRQIENWPGKEQSSGSEAVEDLLRQANKFGAMVIPDTACSLNLSVWPFKVETESGITLRPLALIVATGRIAKRLHVPGVDAYWGRGVGTCTICDAPFHKGQIVGVVGGGDTAGDHALQLAEHAQKVYMIVRGKNLDASEAVQDSLRATKNIELLFNVDVIRLDGDGTGVTGITIKNNKTGETRDLPVHGLYFAIGYHPNSELLKSFIQTDPEGFIVLPDRTQKTSIHGLFVAGDVTDKRYGKAGVATGSGIKAGIDTIAFLQEINFNQTKDQLSTHFYEYKEVAGAEIPCISTVEELEQVIHKNKFVLIDFYANYCPSCKSLIPLLREIIEQMKNEMTVVKVDIATATDLAKKYDINSVPYFILFKDSKVILKRGMIKTRELLNKLIHEVQDLIRK